MNVRRVLEELESKYPHKVIKKLPEENPTEIICEIDPTEEHEEHSETIAIIDKSVPHDHKNAVETYTVIRGELTVYKNGKEHILQEGESLTIYPGEIHYGLGNETWVNVYAKPGWKFEDHIVVKDSIAKQLIDCPGCGVQLASENTALDKDFNASAACRELCYQLSYYTLSLQDKYFIHQLIVDAYAAQHTGSQVKPIATAFALVGLYLVCEKGYTGRQVQQVHMELAKANSSKIWPEFVIPKDKARLTVKDVVASDDQKQELIHKWSEAVWDIWKGEEGKISELLEQYINV